MSSSNDNLKLLTELLDMTNEAWELASEREKPERLRELILELAGCARRERKQLRHDQIGHRYDLCMTGILEELSCLGKVSLDGVIGLDSKLVRVQEEIERTIFEVKANRRVM